MNEKKSVSTKVVILLLTVVLLIGCTIGGTLAWLVTKTDPVENTFTAGNINITLTEPSFQGNPGKLIPGGTIDKDPTVTVSAGSESCYVRMYMVIRWTDEADGWFAHDEADGWFDFGSDWSQGSDRYVDKYSGKTLVNIYEFRYNTAVMPKSEDTVLQPLFTKITVPETLTGEKYASLDQGKIEIIAQAVQSAGFDNADAAFAAAGRPQYITALIEQYYSDLETS